MEAFDPHDAQEVAFTGGTTQEERHDIAIAALIAGIRHSTDAVAKQALVQEIALFTNGAGPTAHQVELSLQIPNPQEHDDEDSSLR